MENKRLQRWLAGLGIMALVFLVMAASPGRAQEDGVAENPDALAESVAEALKTETENLEKLENRLVQVREAKKQAADQISAYKIKYAIFSNQLLKPQTATGELEKSWLEIQNTGRTLSGWIAEVKSKKQIIAPVLEQVKNQVSLTEKQIAEISTEAAATPAEADIRKQLRKLLAIQKEKQEIITSFNGISDEIGTSLAEAESLFRDLSAQFDEAIQKRKKKELLERQTSLVSIGFKQMIGEIIGIPSSLKSIADRSFWTAQLGFAGSAGGIHAVSFALLLVMILGMMFRSRYYLKRLIAHPELEDKKWSRLTLSVLQKSSFMLGATLFLFFYAEFGPFGAIPPIVQALLNIFLVWLFSAACRDVLKFYGRGETVFLPEKPLVFLRLLITMVRWFGITYILFSWLGAGPTALIAWRLLFEIILYGWTIVFWNTLRKAPVSEITGEPSKWSSVIHAFKLVSFAVVFVPLLMEISGYGLLAMYWLVSWGRSIAAALVLALTFLILREWNPKVEKHSESPAEAAVPKNSIRWVMVKILTLVWFAGVVILSVLAWGGKQTVFLGIYHFLQQTYQVGTMRFSLLGFIVAILILLLTQAAARTWRHVFKEKFLGQSGMEEGLQDSITTITVYIIWSVGILIAFNAFGFNATSLTIVIGALGVGLGFGLQAIFNNFISGIILLFERPIQVGDDIEVNGLWARVQKINVRSTVVQTYDNASIIIPNSDLISAQVTNWSFKDKRLRRNVTVGVAYGSDVELVRETLLEVAEKTPRILRLPKPDVVFKDFGDSALIFVLRFWTRVEYFLSVETDVRFAINRLFAERNIEIAFPQQDIHIRSGLEAVRVSSPKDDPPPAE